MSPRFTAFLPFILKEECSYPHDKTGQYSNLKDDDGGPTKWGIDARGYYAIRLPAFSALVGKPVTAETYPAVFAANKSLPAIVQLIQGLSVADATALYWSDYWVPHPTDSLPPKLGECAMNSWVNGGHPTLWVNEANGDPDRYISLMETWYRSIAVGHNRQFLSDWLGRSERLKTYLDL